MKYLFEHLDQLAVWGDILQMAVLELIRKVSGITSQSACQVIHRMQHNSWMPCSAAVPRGNGQGCGVTLQSKDTTARAEAASVILQ